MSDWRDPSSPDWMIRWGVDYDLSWLERELNMPAGTYEKRSLGDALEFVEPHRMEIKGLHPYEFIDRATGRSRKVVIGEITNGIWADGYWTGTA